MAFSSYCRRLVNGSSTLITSRISSSQMRSKHTISRVQTVVSSDRPLRQFVSGNKKSSGRNSAGRITIFHRGGGAKRSQRTIDLKRNNSSVGVVERIEYDPNRTSRIAVIRWVNGSDVDQRKKVNSVSDFPPPRKTSSTVTTRGQFSFSSLPGIIEDKKIVNYGSKTGHVVVGMTHGSKSPLTSQIQTTKNVKDVFLSVFSSSKVKVNNNNGPYSFVSSLGLPRMAVAGAKPVFFIPKIKDEVKKTENFEIKKWDKDSVVWAHKLKRKAAVSWLSFRGKEMLGLVGLENGSKSKVREMEKSKKDGKFTVDRAPVTYILATHNMEAGKMVMNCDSSKRSNDELMHRY